jgi:putative DNA primase/helicase
MDDTSPAPGDDFERFALEYGSVQIWDADLKIPLVPGALRLAIGNERFKLWNSNPAKWVLMPGQIYFDPSREPQDGELNLYGGLALVPTAGDCADLLDLLVHLCSEASDGDEGNVLVLNWVLDWLAYPLQHPGAKMATALVFHGPQGTGKNLFFEAYAQIFGEYAKVIGQAQLESRYNDWASRMLFLICDEVVASNELSHHKNVLKSLITGDTIQIEVKFQALRSERNHANLVFLSNDSKPLALELDDRRHTVILCPEKRTDGLYQRVRDAMASGAVAAFYDFLLKRDLTGFNTHTPPPVTKAKNDLVELGLRPAERFALEWHRGLVDLPMHPCATSQLYRAYTRWSRANGERFPTTQPFFSSAVGRTLRGHGLVKKTASPSHGQAGQPIVFWLPQGTGPLDGVTWYEFASGAVAAFELPLSRFCRADGDGV